MEEWMYRSMFSWFRQLLEVSFHLQAAAALLPAEVPSVTIGYEVGCASQPDWTIWRTEDRVPYWVSNSDPYVTQPVASRCTDCAIMASYCKIWGFQGGDYEECRRLGYKIPVRASQEAHYVSAPEASRLMLCKIWDFHGGDYEECRLLGCYVVWLL
jgi:hypothetical protein